MVYTRGSFQKNPSPMAEVNASSIISGSISYQSGDTVVVYVFKDSGSAVSMADSSTGGLGFWDLYNDLGGLSVYVCFVDSVGQCLSGNRADKDDSAKLVSYLDCFLF